MSRSRDDRPDLDRVIQSMKELEPDEAEVADAAERVWRRLQSHDLHRADSARADATDADSNRADTTRADSNRSDVNRVEVTRGVGPRLLEGCADLQTQLPGYLARALPPARITLIDAHLLECLACRKALHALRDSSSASTGASSPLPAPGRGAGGWGPRTGKEVSAPGRGAGGWGPAAGGWSSHAVARPIRTAALAACGLVAVGVGALLVSKALHDPHVAMGSVASLEGTLLEVGEHGLRPLAAGAPVTGETPIRTARGARAVIVLNDGTRVELRERSELELRDRRAGTTLELERGNILVRAAPQRDKALLVHTPDCDLTVKGTVFSVLTGLKGSRVSVIEGEVQVALAQASRTQAATTLHAGEQLSTSDHVTSVPVASEVVWSREAAAYQAAIDAFRQAGGSGALADPAVRYDTRLLDAMPDTTAVYLGLPNLGAQVGRAWELMSAGIHDNPALARLWQEKAVAAGIDQELESLFGTISRIGATLGDEVAVSLQATDEGRLDGVLLLAEARDEASLRTLVKTLSAKAGDHPTVRLIDAPTDLPAAGSAENHDLLVAFTDGLVAFASSPGPLEQLLTVSAQGRQSPFVSTDFHERIARAYSEGAGGLVAMDLGLMSAGIASGDGEQASLLADLGLLDADYLIANNRTVDGKAQYHAALTFDRERRGIAAWIDAPGPLAGLDFVSPDATLVGGMVLRDPATLLAQLLEILQAHGSSFPETVARIKQEHQIDLVDDLAGSLGGEMIFALDGPLLPTPSWKLIAEVYDEEALQQVIRQAVDRLATTARANQEPAPVRLEENRVGNRTVYSLTVTPKGAVGSGPQIHYVFVDGYVLFAPGRVLLDRAIGYRDNGYTLARSQAFRTLLPEDGYADFSALLYHNLSPLISAVSSALGSQGALATGGTTGSGAAGVVTGSGAAGTHAIADAGVATGSGAAGVTGSGTAGTVSGSGAFSGLGATGAFSGLGGASSPVLVGVYGERDRIVMAGTGNGLTSSVDPALLSNLSHIVATLASQGNTHDTP